MPSPAATEQSIIDSFSIIPDLHERLAAIVESCAGSGIPELERYERDLVPGCVAMVWITGTLENGVLHMHWDSSSPLVKGLAGLICRVYDGTTPADAAAHETTILRGLGLDRQLSPTRLNGLGNAARKIQMLAARLT